MCEPRSIFPRLRLALAVFLLIGSGMVRGQTPAPDPFARFDLPDDWEAKFWAHDDARALLELKPEALAHLVPVQAGLRFCPCPGCGLDDRQDPLVWSIRKPDIVTCKGCGASFPNDKVPATTDKKAPEETIEVVPGVVHKYPYHKVDADHQRFEDDRLYLSARRDYAAREYLAKAALYAAVRHHEQPADLKDPALARLACVLILRFAQVYPQYALHLDQPGQPKFFEPANQPPPYRSGYRTARWDWSGSLEVPINLAVAYALVRDDPEMARAGQLIQVPYPNRTIEVDLFRASARFARDQPREVNEQALQVIRGMLTVGRLLRDPTLVNEVTSRLGDFAEQGFYLDGLWRQGDLATHRRIVGMLEGWFDPLLVGLAPSPRTLRLLPDRSSPEGTPMLALARSAAGKLLSEVKAPEIVQVGWPASVDPAEERRPGLLGGSGVARLAVGQGADALDLELRGMGQHGEARSRRQALRLAVGGKVVLGDLDDLPPRPDGWDRASASHNTVIVDNLNQRETPRLMRETTSGGDFLFFAADPDFQVTILDDPRAYPKTTTLGGYRQTLVACSGPRARYAVSVFEVRGGRQHDQIFQGADGSKARWLANVSMKPGPDSLLDPSIPYLAKTQVEDGRWFVQSYGEFVRMAHGLVIKPALVELSEPGQAGVRLHLLGEAPFQLVTASSPRSASTLEPGRPALIARRTSTEKPGLTSTFVTVFEPTSGLDANAGSTFVKVGKMTETPGWVVLYLETPDGPEHLAINLQPGTPRTVELADGRSLNTDGHVVRARRDNLYLAGGTFANASGIGVRQPLYEGRIVAAVRYPTPNSRGWFETDTPFPNAPNLKGRTLIIRHGDRKTHGWTIDRVEPAANSRTRLYVVEEPGFRIEGDALEARYYQFPGGNTPGPHGFQVSTIAR